MRRRQPTSRWHRSSRKRALAALALPQMLLHRTPAPTSVNWQPSWTRQELERLKREVQKRQRAEQREADRLARAAAARLLPPSAYAETASAQAVLAWLQPCVEAVICQHPRTARVLNPLVLHCLQPEPTVLAVAAAMRRWLQTAYATGKQYPEARHAEAECCVVPHLRARACAVLREELECLELEGGATQDEYMEAAYRLLSVARREFTRINRVWPTSHKAETYEARVLHSLTPTYAAIQRRRQSCARGGCRRAGSARTRKPTILRGSKCVEAVRPHPALTTLKRKLPLRLLLKISSVNACAFRRVPRVSCSSSL